MGHYDNYFDWEEQRRKREKRIKEKTKEIEDAIKKYGLAGYLAREEVGY